MKKRWHKTRFDQERNKKEQEWAQALKNLDTQKKAIEQQQQALKQELEKERSRMQQDNKRGRVCKINRLLDICRDFPSC
ncbi:hypothetical protein [Helicobacter suis]|uniref:hypothetical protein n=1 Tax=Helicobacter suis TaxID=104628 RepID=UPI0013D3CDED|nr:hypothetical protein [Helicobacter suis]